MNTATPIRLLASTNNERGDLFTRLTKDLFFALGYDELLLDVQKSGREIDVQGTHRFEQRRVLGECKAHSDPVGGDALNKFLGALTRERNKSSQSPVSGYFVSLNGFTGTAIQQEEDSGGNQIIILDANRVVEELQNCRVIVPLAEAVEHAGRCVHHFGLTDAALDGIELLGHQCGYVWAVYYAIGKVRTHFALIHANGIALGEPMAKKVIEQDSLCAGILGALGYVAPPAAPPDRRKLTAEMIELYFRWVGEECGYIHLDGLPADSDLSATRLKLERLLVPAKVQLVPKAGAKEEHKEEMFESPPLIGELLSRSLHVALLATPGGGKSTLLKRIATAYAFPERRKQVRDKLPVRDWLPLVLRCRELRDRAHRPLIELLEEISLHAGMNEVQRSIFKDLLHVRLLSGQVLVMIDGLDEISDEGARKTFAGHLRTFIGMFPRTALIVTSRKAGYRQVAGVVASICEQAELAPLDQEDVLNLCERWHVEVVADNEKVRSDARELAETIWRNRHMRILAENPLLLTTLLVVKRWIRELPRSRSALYREAIRVLVRTWNVEGYAPLDEDETLVQLSYVACSMMNEGKQQIGYRALLNLLEGARRELGPELQFARISPGDFLERIEYRSSLLMQTGHEMVESELQPLYEFRHLTFQEYLAARGYVEEQYPGRDSGNTLTETLKNHFLDERWAEVIPLAAVLAGRKAEQLIVELTKVCSQNPGIDTLPSDQNLAPNEMLHQCIVDEVQVTVPALKSALKEVARTWDSPIVSDISIVLGGKFGTLFREIAEEALLTDETQFGSYLSVNSALAKHDFLGDGEEGEERITKQLSKAISAAFEAGNRIQKIKAALMCMTLAYNEGQWQKDRNPRPLKALLKKIAPHLSGMINSNDLPSAFSAGWALAWIGDGRLLGSPPEPKLIIRLFELWRQMSLPEQARWPAWALGAQRLLPRDAFDSESWGTDSHDCDEFLEGVFSTHDATYRRGFFINAATVVSWYRRSPFNDSELLEIIALNEDELTKTIRDLLEKMGPAGMQMIERKDSERESRMRRAIPHSEP